MSPHIDSPQEQGLQRKRQRFSFEEIWKNIGDVLFLEEKAVFKKLFSILSPTMALLLA